MCIYSPMPHTLSYCALIGKCALIRSNMVFITENCLPLTDEVTVVLVLKCLQHLHLLALHLEIRARVHSTSFERISIFT